MTFISFVSKIFLSWLGNRRIAAMMPLLTVKRKRLDMNMGYCCKIFSAYLRMNGIKSELIDLLLGRIPKTVFARHYFRPDFDKGMLKEYGLH